MNPIEVYTDTGRKAGRAARRRDMSTATFHNSWLTRALALEPADRRAECRKAYNDAYREEARP